MEPIDSSETSAYNNTLTPGTYPKEKKLQSKHGESLKSRIKDLGHLKERMRDVSTCHSLVMREDSFRKGVTLLEFIPYLALVSFSATPGW